MLYPEMSAEVHSQASSTSRRIWVRAAVSGFELDLAPSLAGYIFSLVDVYRLGKEHFERFSPQSRAGEVTPPERSTVRTNSSDTTHSALPTSDIRMSLEFRSGKVHFHRPDENVPAPEYPFMPLWGPDSMLHDFSRFQADDSDVFNLPVVSVSVEYHATPASQKTASTSDGSPTSSLMFNVVVHSSRNTISPTILPFLTEITRQVEERLSHTSPVRKTRPRVPVPDTPPGRNNSPGPGAITAMEISFSLRIDKSDLQFTCLPDVNVAAGLHWESGGFVLRVAPGSREIGLVGSIEGITTSLRHGYLVEDCVKVSARDLTFALAFSTVEGEQGYPINSVSLVVNTQMEGIVRFSRLQDVLCFKAVWLDRIAVFEGLSKDPVSPAPTLDLELPASIEGGDLSVAPRKGFLTSILVRVERIRLQVDLGQAITKLTLDLQPVIFCTRLTDSLSEISFSSDRVKLDAERALSGTITIPNLTFETVRRRKNLISQSRLLELTIRSGQVDVSVNYETKKILILRCAFGLPLVGDLG